MNKQNMVFALYMVIVSWAGKKSGWAFLPREGVSGNNSKVMLDKLFKKGRSPRERTQSSS